MSILDTENNVSKTSVSDGINTDILTGGDESDTSNEKKSEKDENQIKIDRIVKEAKKSAEQATRIKLQKEMEGKVIFENEDAFNTKINELRQNWENETKLNSVRNAIKDEYNLTDKQLAVLDGDDEESLRTNANELFGALKKKDAPKINPGATGKANTSSSNDSFGDSLLESMKQRSERLKSRRKY